MAVKLNQHDLEFILKQIKIAEAHVAGTPLDQLLAQPHLPYGLRTVDGSLNNITPGRELWGAADQIMPRAMQPHYMNEDDDSFHDMINNNDYGVVGEETGSMAQNGGHTGNVVDADPRIISNLISDQTLNNPAAITAALQYAEYADLAGGVAGVRAEYANYLQAIEDGELGTPGNEEALAAAKTALDQALLDNYGIEMDGNSILLPNVAPDEGLSAPFNGWMTFFGQFFDHGLDLIHKGDNGTIYMPLTADDPLVTHGPDGIPDSGDEVDINMPLVLTRLTPTMAPGEDGVLGTADDTPEAKNKTTPFVDQNQTYTSHPSHQVFLRQYEMVDGKPMATGRLLDGGNGGLATWKDVKDQAEAMLGINLDDRDIFGVPLLRTDPYGEFIRDENGFPQVVTNIGPDLIPNTADDVVASGTPDNPLVLAELNDGRGPVRTSHAFLDDIAHNAVPILVPGAEGQPAILMPDTNSGTDPIGDPIPVDPDTEQPLYDNELLDRHFIVGDGRGNENIGLTAVHHVFHSEHNRQVEANKTYILELAEAGDIDFLNEWLLEPVEAGFDPASLNWDGERLFQTARFSTEMQYQHLVFEEFGRKVSPLIDVFVFNTVTDVDPAIFAEFAHTVYRFGHSMLTDHLKLLPLNEAGEPVDADGNLIPIEDWGVDVGLIEAFLNPVSYDQDGAITADQAAGAIFRGMTYVHGNEIDEFVVDSLRNNLLGLPLDLPAINIARGRDAGVPSLNEAREQLYAASNSTWLKPYESWADFGANLKTPASIINFIAAYGTHSLVTEADTLAEKRDAAMQLLGLSEATAAEAAVLTNASFEANSLDAGQPGVNVHVDGNYTTAAPDGWMLAGEGGLIAPASTIVDQAGVDGSNVAWLREGGMLSQNTGQTLEEGVNYRLTIDVGDRIGMDWPGGEARLVTATGVVLASVSLAEPADGEWSTVTLETGLIDAAHDGLGLSIEIQHPGGTADQILIDNVGVDVLRPTAIGDRLDFLNGTGDWAGVETGLNLVDLWIGGLAEKIMPFGGMLGPTFNAVFELQLENLQEGDRFYYLSRTQGLNLLNELEDNAFSKMVMANTDMALPGADGILGTEDDEVNFHVGVDSFAKHDIVLEVDESKQIAMDPEGDDPVLNAIRDKVQRDDPSTPGVDENYLRFTGGEHAVLGGTENDDTIIGGDGDNAIWGDAGNDRIEGGHGVDLIIGGAGDDIITDTGDTGDFIKGSGGDDVIANSNGLDVVMGGDGEDVVLVGVDATEVFGGEGDDFILGGLDHDFLMGNEGSDWIEGGDGFDVIAGDNSELFFNSTILGHDVMFAGANENDFDAESGDDIMVQGESVMRNEGMFGFDWAIHKGSPVAADSDMRIPIFTTVADDILRDRFDQTEGLSGWIHDDVLRGDDRGSTEEIEVEFSLDNHGLTQAGVNRIDGLRELLGISIEDAPTDPDIDLEEVVAWAEGNMLLGGDGNDTFEGRGADDFIHGDAWLNVRLSIRELDAQGNVVEGTEAFTVDSLTDMVTLGGETKELSNFLLEGGIKPKQLKIVREIKYDENSTNDTDTAIFAGNRDWYEITHVGDRTYVARREMEEVDPQIDEGTDTLIGIERIQFADGIYTIRETGNVDPTGRLVIEGLPAREDQPLTVSADNIRDLNNPDGSVDPTQMTFRWQIERNDGTGDYIDIPNVNGLTFTPSDEHDGLRIRVLGSYYDAGGVLEIVSSQPTDPVIGVNDEPTGPLLISDMSPTEGQELTATVAFSDPDGMTDAFEEGLLTYQWQFSADGVSGWNNVPAEDGGNDRSFVPGPELVGYRLQMVVDYFDDLLNEHQVVSDVTQVVGNYIETDDAVVNGTTGGDAEGGATQGDDIIIGGASANELNGQGGNDTLNGGDGDDRLLGANGDDTLDGGLGDDQLIGHAGSDTAIYRNGHGSDTINLGPGQDRLRILESTFGADDVVEVQLSGGSVNNVNGTTTVVNVEATELDLAGGNDTLIYATAEDVTLNLLTGAATGFSVTRGVENITGGTGNDTLSGNSLDNRLDGRDGNDSLHGGFGNDTVLGGVGGDDLYGEEGDDILEGGDGDDRVDGGAGRDTASYAAAAAGVTVSLLGQAGRASFEEQDTIGAGTDRLIDIENLVGSGHDDNLTGNDGNNVIDGGAGADMMDGGAGDDTFVIDADGDVVSGGDGIDTIRASIAINLHPGLDDQVIGGHTVENAVLLGSQDLDARGNGVDNQFTGNAGNNTLHGANGTDTVVLEGSITDYTFAPAGNNLTVTSVAGGTDTLIAIERVAVEGSTYNIVTPPMSGSNEADLMLGFGGNDSLSGGAGDDIFLGGGGADTMIGGAGNDTFVVTDDGDVVNGGGGVDTLLSSISVNLHPGLDDQVIGGHTVENAVLLGGSDLNARGNGVDNLLTGNAGDNTLVGANGNDELIGNGGGDTLRGGNQDDVLDGGEGNDVLNGGGGIDTARFAGSAGDYTFGVSGAGLSTVTHLESGDEDTLIGIERLQFGEGEMLNIVSGDGDVTSADPGIIFGGDGDDSIVGSNGDDVIIGGAGNDTLQGHDLGDGDDDVVEPQLDDDTFIWRPGDGMDNINGGGEGAEGDTFQVVGNAQAETYRIYTYDEAVARIAYAGSDENEIIVTRQVQGEAETIIAELTEIEEIVVNGGGVSDSGQFGGDTVEMYGSFDVATSLRPDTITILGSNGDDTVDISSLLSDHRIVFKGAGGNDTIVGTLRPQDVVELMPGTTIDDYVTTTNEDGSTTISTEGHSVTFRSSGQPPVFGAGTEDVEGSVAAPEDDHHDNGVVAPPAEQTGHDDQDDVPANDADQPSADEAEVVVPTPAAVVAGSESADALVGTADGETLMGLGGRDVVFGHDGDDDILGGAGDDMLYGDGGDDRMLGEAGSDFINAGAGDDTVFGGDGDDMLVAEAGDGDDTYYGDDMVGADGSDTLDMSAITAAITADLGTGFMGRGSVSSAATGNDGLWGVENIVTGSGDDTVTASGAANVMDGGAGNDTFRFLTAADANGDTIMGFQPGDRIDLSGLDANGCASGSQSFTLVNEAFTGAGQLMFSHQTLDGEDYTVVQGNTSGDDDADFAISIKGRHELGVSDFNL
ncbi:peroxidase family protein [Halomonas sabkhae]|uniref:peroxidase family protein n=1 Tax=Halomonas sabkhae TaxID=626223 RepID=UPI0025B35AD9|nr:peroxidase family protein [Halomonas sabkhae]MDN3524741.1 peroxidase family protein [Halomonas sabkhae]